MHEQANHPFCPGSKMSLVKNSASPCDTIVWGSEEIGIQQRRQGDRAKSMGGSSEEMPPGESVLVVHVLQCFVVWKGW